MSSTHLVIMGDVVDSRRSFETATWQTFHDEMDQLNAKYSEELIIPLTVYSGDSFGCICRGFQAAAMLIQEIVLQKTSFTSRLTLVEDHIHFGMNSGNFQILEGPALWNGQQNLNQMKENNSLFQASLQNTVHENILNTIVSLILVIKDKWSVLNYDVSTYYSAGDKQQTIAEKLDISQQYVSKKIRNSKMDTVLQAEHNLISIMQNWDTSSNKDNGL